MPEMPEGSIDLAIKRITQPETRYLRNRRVTLTPHAQVGQNVNVDPEDPASFSSQMTISVASTDPDTAAFEFYSEVLVEFSVRPGHEERLTPDAEIDGVVDYVRKLADPYHRRSLTDSMASAGLDPFTLPLPHASGWHSEDGDAPL